MALILASGSPRRRELLTQMGLAFTVCSPDIDEHVDGNPAPAQLVELLSQQKAAAVSAQKGDVVLAADTVVAYGGAILGKPKSEQHAREMLARLSGNTHEVFTGFTLRRGAQVFTAHGVTRVTFRALAPAEIDAYLQTGEPMDKAGAYGIQGRGALLISAIEGDYFNVMGLPVCQVAQAMREFGIFCL